MGSNLLTRFALVRARKFTYRTDAPGRLDNVPMRAIFFLTSHQGNQSRRVITPDEVSSVSEKGVVDAMKVAW
jgi:hypothetical protein